MFLDNTHGKSLKIGITILDFIQEKFHHSHYQALNLQLNLHWYDCTSNYIRLWMADYQILALLMVNLKLKPCNSQRTYRKKSFGFGKCIYPVDNILIWYFHSWKIFMAFMRYGLAWKLLYRSSILIMLSHFHNYIVRMVTGKGEKEGRFIQNPVIFKNVCPALKQQWH